MAPEWLTPEIRDLLIEGVRLTIFLTVSTSILALGVGVLICRLRLSVWRFWRTLAVIYIELCRNIPALVWVIFFAYALPNIFDLHMRRALFFNNAVMHTLRDMTGVQIPYYMIGAALGLTLNTSAYIAELLRAGIGTLPVQHMESARSLGATPNIAFNHILLPYGIRTASPALITRLVHHLKNTTLAALVAVPEFFKAIQTAISRTFYAVELLILASIVYWLLAWSFAAILRVLLSRPLEQT